MLLMPVIYRRFTLKAILLIGLLGWSVRYALFGYGDAGAGMWMFYAAILLHGVCYDFFFMTGQLYTDQEAPAHLRGTAQGLIAFLTLGLGMFVGSLISGGAKDYFATTTAGTTVTNWTGFWVASGLAALAIFLFVAIFFRSSGRVQSKCSTPMSKKKSTKTTEATRSHMSRRTRSHSSPEVISCWIIRLL